MDDHGSRQAAGTCALACALDRYELAVRPLARGWDPEAYAAASAAFDDMRKHAVRCSYLQVYWTCALISRYELTHRLWELQNGAADRSALRKASDRHFLALTELRRASSPCGGRDVSRLQGGRSQQ